MGSANILIVEDNLLIAEDLKQTLHGFGYNISGVESNGISAINSVTNFNPDLILMDIKIDGDLNGIETAGKIKSLYNIPVIFLTAFMDDETVDSAFKLNPNGYILKPFRKNDLYAKIEIALLKNLPSYISNSSYFSTLSTSISSCNSIEELKSFQKDLPFRTNKITNKVEDQKQIKTSYDKELEKYGTDLLTLIDKIIIEDINDFHKSLLARTCTKIAELKVARKYSRLKNVNRQWELSITDIANDAIASLFTFNNKMNMSNFKSSFIKYSDQINNATEALKSLNKIIEMSINQTISKIFRDSDPFFSKTLDKIIYEMKKNGIVKKHHNGIVYIVKEDDINSGKNFIDIDDFYELDLEHTIPEINSILKLMKHLSKETDYAKAVPLNAFIERYLHAVQMNNDPVPKWKSSEFLKISTNNIIENALMITFDKLEKTYGQRYSSVELDCFRKSLIIAAVDLRSGHSIWGVNKNFMHFSDCSSDKFNSDYKNTLEYLIKYLRGNISALLSQN